MAVWNAGLTLIIIIGSLTFAEPANGSSPPACPVRSMTESIFRSRYSSCGVDGAVFASNTVNIVEGDEVELHKALNMLYTRTYDNVALLFYASWCPFSAIVRPKFSVLSSLYPYVPHIAIDESVIKPSTLSKYGVHGFPTLILMNSTLRMRYQGSRTLDSLTAFYIDFTGQKITPLDGSFMNGISHLPNNNKNENGEEDSCPFSWAKSPENMLQQETYLALAIAFVVLRLLYLAFPTLLILVRFAWRNCILSMRLRYLWETLIALSNRILQLFSSLKDPCKRSNLQGGAMNAQAWASKSLASVTFGDASSSRL
ncbi:5'-adenylylsulfate reductase-like 4 [Impatiens glandulifera]|uniref:5'-adenylylsulfate reductase-like 4 n=1 Tax=Impatiens glandulifera TaxID=253017 RepID=UPI001FB13A3C|nr:5'-adenylylsulfate reductase-like 4 [Impatiens glandulifera]